MSNRTSWSKDEDATLDPFVIERRRFTKADLEEVVEKTGRSAKAVQNRLDFLRSKNRAEPIKKPKPGIFRKCSACGSPFEAETRFVWRCRPCKRVEGTGYEFTSHGVIGLRLR